MLAVSIVFSLSVRLSVVTLTQSFLIGFIQNFIYGLLPTTSRSSSNTGFVRHPITKIPARSHTSVEIDHEIISTVILLPSAYSFKKGCCQLQAKVCARINGYLLVQACPGKGVVR